MAREPLSEDDRVNNRTKYAGRKEVYGNPWERENEKPGIPEEVAPKLWCDFCNELGVEHLYLGYIDVRDRKTQIHIQCDHVYECTVCGRFRLYGNSKHPPDNGRCLLARKEGYHVEEEMARRRALCG